MFYVVVIQVIYLSLWGEMLAALLDNRLLSEYKFNLDL